LRPVQVRRGDDVDGALVWWLPRRVQLSLLVADETDHLTARRSFTCRPPTCTGVDAAWGRAQGDACRTAHLRTVNPPAPGCVFRDQHLRRYDQGESTFAADCPRRLKTDPVSTGGF